MIYRYTLNMRHSLDRLSDMFYWPLMDLFLWGLTGLYFARINSQNPHAVDTIITGVVFWLIIWRAQYEINLNLLTELWDKNLVNIFASPLKIEEWMLSFVIFGFIKMLISLSFISLLAFILYKFNFFVYGLFIPPIVITLSLTGWVFGFFIAGFLIRFGERIQTLAWVGVTFIMPLSALYYPLSVLPSAVRKIAFFVPSAYVFEGMREIINKGTFPVEKLVLSFILNILYLSLAIMFFLFMFNRSKKLGLGRLI